MNLVHCRSSSFFACLQEWRTHYLTKAASIKEGHDFPEQAVPVPNARSQGSGHGGSLPSSSQAGCCAGAAHGLCTTSRASSISLSISC